MEDFVSFVKGVKMLFYGQVKSMISFVFWMYQFVFNLRNVLEGGKIGGRDWLEVVVVNQVGIDGI